MKLDFHSPAVPRGAHASDRVGTARVPACLLLLLPHAAAPQTFAMGSTHPQPWAHAAPPAPHSSASFSAACVVPAMPLAPNSAPSLSDELALMDTRPSTPNDGGWETAWRLCRCHPKLGLNTPGRGEQPTNGAGGLLRTGAGAGGTLKEALRKGQGVLDPFCPTQRDPRKEQQPRSGADSFVLPGRVPWSRGRRRRRNSPATAKILPHKQQSGGPRLLCPSEQEKVRAVPASFGLNPCFLPAGAACQGCSGAALGRAVPSSLLCQGRRPASCWLLGSTVWMGMREWIPKDVIWERLAGTASSTITALQGWVTVPSTTVVRWRRKPQNLLFSPFSQPGQGENAAWFLHAQQYSHVYRSLRSPSEQHGSEYFLEAFQATSLCMLE